MSRITIIGPREARSYRDGQVVNTVSQEPGCWRALSPFALGPVTVLSGARIRQSLTMENAWQFSKVYNVHVDAQYQPGPNYFQWADEGFASPRAFRYPMGKGATPLYSLWENEKLSYIEARKRIYLPLYRDAVKDTQAFRRLQEWVASDRDLILFDFDGYDHDQLNMGLVEVLNSSTKKMGHAFVLKMMLLYGENVTADFIDALPRPPHARRGQPQRTLFHG